MRGSNGGTKKRVFTMHRSVRLYVYASVLRVIIDMMIGKRPANFI